jgi:hypothetical protein
MAAPRAAPLDKARASLGACIIAHFLFVVVDRPFQLAGNPLPSTGGLTFADTDKSGRQCARRVKEIIAATTHIGMIRERATEICVALQELDLPAFVTLQIVDAAVHENSIRMWAKWELITAVKHFRQRRGVEH